MIHYKKPSPMHSLQVRLLQYFQTIHQYIHIYIQALPSSNPYDLWKIKNFQIGIDPEINHDIKISNSNPLMSIK